MNCVIHDIKYKDMKDLTVQMEFTVALSKVEGSELIGIKLFDEKNSERAHNFAAKILRSMKRDGVIKLFVFENELNDTEKTETVYLLNKFPYLSEIKKYSADLVYIKL